MMQGVTEFTQLARNALRSFGWREATICTLTFGVLIRLWFFLNGSALWIDEAMIALNLRHHTFAGLLQPLDYNQIAPVGWLLLHKAILNLWTNIDYSMRFLSLLFGVGTLLVLHRMASRCMQGPSTFLVVTLLSILPVTIRYSLELKPYIGDMFFSAVIALCTAGILREKRSSIKKTITLFLWGVIGIVFSFPIVIILASAGCVLLLKAFIEKDYRFFIQLVAMCAAWMSVFLIIYLTFHNQPSAVVSWMRENWDEGFVPNPFSSLASLRWFVSSVHYAFVFLFTKEAAFMAGGLYVTGIFGLYRSSRYYIAVFLALPLIFALLVSMLHLYPFIVRLNLYLLPILVLGVGFGFDYLLGGSRHVAFPAALIGCVLIIAVAWNTISRPYIREDVHPAMNTLSKEIDSGDEVYVYFGALPAFWLYRDRYGSLRNVNVHYGRTPHWDWNCFLLDLNNLKGRGRVWAFFSHMTWRSGVQEDKLFLYYAKKMGDIIVDYRYRDVRLVLLDLDKIDSDINRLLEGAAVSNEQSCQQYWSLPIPLVDAH